MGSFIIARLTAVKSKELMTLTTTRPLCFQLWVPVGVEFGIVVSPSMILRNNIFDHPEFYEWLKPK